MKNESYATIQFQRAARVLQPFEGANNQVMQRLLSGKEDGIKVDFTRLPITTKQLAQARLGSLEGTNEADQKYFRSVYVDTSTAVLPNPRDDDVKFDREYSLVYSLTPKIKLVGGNLRITRAQYDSSTGFHLNKSDANELRDNPYALPNIRRAFWEDQLEGDTQLTKDYIIYVEKKTGMKFENIMGLRLPQSKGLRLLNVDRVGDSKSDANSRCDLDCTFGRLVGYVAEPQLVAKKTGIPLEKLV